MPKVVDHEKRKNIIAQATWRVILKQGMKGATVRNIAKEAGLSLGALRHYFRSQEDLLIYTMDLVKERATERIMNIALSNMPPKEKTIHMLLELVPTNETTKAEMEVWLEFTFYFRNKGNIEMANQDGIREGVYRLVTFLESQQLLKNGLDLEVEVERLHALVDGLAIHAILEPERLTKEKIIDILTRHLEEILE